MLDSRSATPARDHSVGAWRRQEVRIEVPVEATVIRLLLPFEREGAGWVDRGSFAVVP
jgi:hypothetical protein